MAVDAIVIALGNPGSRYLKTRHNAGFMLADLLAHEESLNFTFKKNLEAEILEGVFEGKKLVILKPLTYMNLSGRSLAKLYQQNKELREVDHIVLHDEVDVRFGRIKLKQGGSDAGHNGLKSLREAMGHGESIRLRLGVGRPAHGDMDVADYVLQSFSREEENTAIDLLANGAKVFRRLLNQGLASAQTYAGELDVT
ncbi:aminoacyl-tRNA hydrolase [bacterium]|nr:aminoacyl-tRNA hydrolase [bacterium]